MSPIRRLEPDDLPAVASLYERIMRSGSSTPAPGLIEHFRRVLDHPWSDPELASLVYVDANGRIAGFMGSHARRVSIDGREGRLVCGGPLVADHNSGNLAIGGLLLRALLGGPQDVTITDGATEEVRRMWGRLGGVTAQLRSLDWIKVLHPCGLAARHFLGASSSGALRTRALHRVAAGSDAVLTRVAPRQLAIADPGDVQPEPLTPELVLEHLPALSPPARLHLAYDLPYLQWLFGELAAIKSRGRLSATLLRANNGRVLGWYIAYIPRHDIALALQIVARERDAGIVFDHLMRSARDGRAPAVRGRVEPQLLDSLAAHGILFRHAGAVLVHSRHPGTAALASSSDARLTLLDGEHWMEPHLL